MNQLLRFVDPESFFFVKMVKIFFLSAIEFKMWIIIACFMLLPILNQQLIRFGLKNDDFKYFKKGKPRRSFKKWSF